LTQNPFVLSRSLLRSLAYEKTVRHPLKGCAIGTLRVKR
jgi:hypothetical protein